MGLEWLFNYTFLNSPIVWMDLSNNIIDNGVQITNSKFSVGSSQIYTKQIYVTTGYLINIIKNITRVSDNKYNINITLRNNGPSIIPSNQVIVVYNFLENSFNLNSSFNFLQSSWYSTASTNTSLNDPIYNGTMYQFALIPSNIYNSSLSGYQGIYNSNNTWNVIYNVSGSGEFNYDDLFLTGVDPLHVNSVGASQAIIIEGNFNIISDYFSLISSFIAALVIFILILF